MNLILHIRQHVTFKPVNTDKHNLAFFLIFVVPFIVILGRRNTTRCNCMQKFNFCTLQYGLYQRLQLQFYALLVMGTMDARNMQSNFAVNKYLHTVASCWISSTYNLVCWYNFASGRVRIVAKSANNPSHPFVRPSIRSSVCMYQSGSQRTDFHDI